MLTLTVHLMRLAIQPAASAWLDWLKLIVPAVFLAGIALGWSIVRPAVTRLLFYFLRHEDGQLLFQKYFGETMGGLNVELATTTSAVRTLQRKVDDFEKTQARTEIRVSDMATDIRRAVERFDASIEKLALALATIEGANEERRWSKSNHPRRRDTD